MPNLEEDEISQKNKKYKNISDAEIPNFLYNKYKGLYEAIQNCWQNPEKNIFIKELNAKTVNRFKLEEWFNDDVIFCLINIITSI